MGQKDKIAERVSQIKTQILETKSEYDKENLQERLAKIAGGVAVIGVGAATEVEMKDKKLRIEDALSATKAAVEEGIVSGGGTALINVIPKVESIMNTLEGGEKLGAEIVLKALEEPVKQIAINAGLEPAVIVDKVKKKISTTVYCSVCWATKQAGSSNQTPNRAPATVISWLKYQTTEPAS